MCTLAGFINLLGEKKENFLHLLTSMDKYINLRGRDIQKAITINNQHVLQSHITQQFDFGLRNEYLSNTIACSCVTRAIPAAEIYNIGEENTQPFIVTKNNTKYIVSHNGLISNDKQILKTYLPELNNIEQVDTKTIAHYFAKNEVNIKSIERIQGSFAFAIIKQVKKKETYSYTLYLCTNFMPLFYVQNSNQIFWASDPLLLFHEKSTNEIKEIKPYTLIVFDFQKGTKKIIPLPNTLNTKKALVICSGGMDSVTTAIFLKKMKFDVSLIHFKYGQAAMEVEEWAVKKLSKKYNMPLFLLNVIDLFKNISSTSLLLTRKQANIKLRHKDMESTLSYVNARNFIFTSLAMGIAEKNNIGTIGLGLNLDDSSYPDNNVGFLRALTNISPYALNWNHAINVIAPFVHLTKKEILSLAIALKSPIKDHVSCYYPTLNNGKIMYCGKCGCCNLRENAFKALKIIDPVPYIKQPKWKDCVPLENINLSKHKDVNLVQCLKSALYALKINDFNLILQ